MSYIGVAVRILLAGFAAFTVYRAILEDESAWDTIPVQTTLVLALLLMWAAWAVLAERKPPPAWIDGGVVLYAVVQGLLLTIRSDGNMGKSPLFFGLTNTEFQLWVLPAGAVLVWILFSRHHRISWYWLLVWPTYILGWVAFFSWRGSTVKNAKYPHEFINVDNLEWRGVMENALLFVFVLIVAGAIMIGLDRVLPRRSVLAGEDEPRAA